MQATQVPILSFCISTLNRADIAYDCIQSVLAYKSDDIEVIVSNNGSTDHTHKRLSPIRDPRFRYYRNEKNIGPNNIIKALFLSQGRFAVIVSDEDPCITDNLPAVINFLKQNPSLSVVLPTLQTYSEEIKYGFRSDYQFINSFYDPGLDAMAALGFFRTYLTGIIVNTQNLKTITSKDQICARGGKYPHAYYLNRLLNHGDSASLYIPLFEINRHHNKMIFYDKNGYFDDHGNCILNNCTNLSVEIIAIRNSLEDVFAATKECIAAKQVLVCCFFIKCIRYTELWVGSRMQFDEKKFDFGVPEEYFTYEEYLSMITKELSRLNDIFNMEGYDALLNDVRLLFCAYYTSRFDEMLYAFFKRYPQKEMRGAILRLLHIHAISFAKFILTLGERLKGIKDFIRAVPTLKTGIEYYKLHGAYNTGFGKIFAETQTISAYQLLGEIYYETGETHSAKAYFEQCLALSDGTHSTACEYLRKIVMSDRSPQTRYQP